MNAHGEPIEALAASALTHPDGLSAREIREQFGSAREFFANFGLEPSQRRDRDEARSISRGLKSGSCEYGAMSGALREERTSERRKSLDVACEPLSPTTPSNDPARRGSEGEFRVRRSTSFISSGEMDPRWVLS